MIYLDRLQFGNTAHLKSFGDGLVELRMQFGAGYRVYFGREGSRILLMLAAGSKRRQSIDIDLASRLWAEYLQSKGE